MSWTAVPVRFGDIAAAPGQPAIDEGTRRTSAFADRYASHYLAAVRCLTDTLPGLTVHLRFPDEQWRRIRRSDFIERTFGETRPQAKVIGRAAR